MDKNLQRQRKAAQALREYLEVGFQNSEKRLCAMIDLVTDLYHLADHWGIKFPDVIRIATNHHLEELRGQEKKS